MGTSAIALQGMQQAESQLDQSAAKVASAGLTTTSGNGTPVDSVNLSAELVGELSAKDQYAANVDTLKTAGAMMQTTIDLMA